MILMNCKPQVELTMPKPTPFFKRIFGSSQLTPFKVKASFDLSAVRTEMPGFEPTEWSLQFELHDRIFGTLFGYETDSKNPGRAESGRAVFEASAEELEWHSYRVMDEAPTVRLDTVFTLRKISEAQSERLSGIASMLLLANQSS